MNNESGSALQKASFVLLLLIVAALAYLIVRDRIRTDQQRAEAERAAAAASSAAAEAAARPFNPSEMKSSFAPLRPRAATNAARVSVNNVPAASRPNSISLIQPTATDASVPIASFQANEQPVPAAITSGRSGAQGGASIFGRVTLRGTPPPEKPITLDAACGRLNSAPITTRHYLVGDDGGLANVFVYIKLSISDAPQSSIAVLDNVNCQFEPYVLGVRTRQLFQIRNSDPILHNIHSLPKKSGNHEFNIGLSVAGGTQQKSFDKPEVFVQLKCEVHPWMFAYLGVVDHPWFAVTDQNGHFTLPPGLPRGKWPIAAVHPKAGESVQQIIVTEDGAAPVSFTLDVPDRLAKSNSP